MSYFSKLEHWLVSPRIAPWLSAEPLTLHGIYHLPVVFSLQKTAKKRYIKPHNPFSYERPVQWVKTAQAETTHSTKGSRKSRKQPPWWDSETEKAWTPKGAAAGNWQKWRTLPNPDPKLKTAMDTKTQQFKQIAREAKEAKWKGFCEELITNKTLTILPTNETEWSYQNSSRLRRRQQVKAKDQRRERSSFTRAIHTTEQPKQLRGNEAYTERSQQKTCTKWPRRWIHIWGIIHIGPNP